MPEQPPREPPDWPREPLLPYNGLALDRAVGRRADDAWLRGVARRPGSRLLALWQDKCLVDASGLEPVTIPMAGAGALLGPSDEGSAGTGVPRPARSPSSPASSTVARASWTRSAGWSPRRPASRSAGSATRASQAWPYPSGIMVGFLARAASDAISVDGDELVEARWFTRAALAAHRAARPRTHGDSIGTHLLDAWLAAGD
jgi:hypothetical protein